MSVKACSLLTGHPTRPDSLWPDMQPGGARSSTGRSARLYLSPPPGRRRWTRPGSCFRRALMPLHSAGQAGRRALPVPARGSGPRPRTGPTLADAVARGCPTCDCAVEFRHGSWLARAANGEPTLERARAAGASAFVCVDEPSGLLRRRCRRWWRPPPTSPSSASTAATRPPGRTGPSPPPPSASAYRYSTGRAGRVGAPNLRQLAGSARETHALMNNCYRDYAVDNGQQLAALLGEGLQPGA